MRTNAIALLTLTLVGCGSVTWKDKNGNEVTATQAKTGTTEGENEGKLSESGGSLSLKTFSVTPSGCQGKWGETFDSGEGLVSFVIAECTDTTQVYAASFSYEGIIGSSWKMLSDCRYGVVLASVGQSPNGFLTSYSCSHSGTISTHIKQVATDLSSSEPRELERFNAGADYAQFAHKTVWNPEANAFGVVSKNGLVIVDETAVPLSGVVPVGEGVVQDVTVSDGRWLVLQHGALYSNTLTTVNPDSSSEGTKPISINREGSSPEDVIRFVGSNLLSSSSYAHGYRTSDIQGTDPSPLFSQGYEGELLAGVALDSRYGFALQNKEKSLVLQKVQFLGIPSFAEEWAIAPRAEHASVRLIKNSLMITYTITGRTQVLVK